MKVEDVRFKSIDPSLVRKIESLNISSLYKLLTSLHLSTAGDFERQDILRILSYQKQNRLRKALKEINYEC